MIHVIGAGLAGCEAALQLGMRGMSVTLHEMRPAVRTAVHKGGGLAELVCSNSLKGTRADSAAGLIKHELCVLGSQLIQAAFKTRVPAGGALAVDREEFSADVEARVLRCDNIELVREEVEDVQSLLSSEHDRAIVAAGPLCSDALSACIVSLVGSDGLAFFDAAAPIVEADSLDMSRLFAQSRHGHGGDDYLNAPLDKAEYDKFISELAGAKRAISHDFETSELFSACQPAEQVALSGHDALRFGAMKPVGLKDPSTGKRPWAAVQLRAENKARTAYNLVGFQTNLTFSEQERVFRMIPGLGGARFARYGVMHRNTFLDSPHTLGMSFELECDRRIRFAGQICGTEGYCEAMASGLYAALCIVPEINGSKAAPILPAETAMGSLFAYATDPDVTDYQPMHANFGIMPPLDPPVRNKRQRYEAYAKRAHEALVRFMSRNQALGFLAGCDMRLELERTDAALSGKEA